MSAKRKWWQWCSHPSWVTVSVTHTPGVVFTKIYGYSIEETLAVKAGQTHVVQRCIDCGTHRGYSLPGVHELKAEVGVSA